MSNNTATPGDHPARSALLDALPLSLLVGLLALWWLGWPGLASSDGEQPPLKSVAVETSDDLDGLFVELGYTWPAEHVPAIALRAFPADLAEIQPGDRKRLFLKALLPIVLAENARITEQRAQLERALGQDLTEQRRRNIINRLAAAYGVEGDPREPSTIAELQRRVQPVPVALVLAQAAQESGWGTSRFAQEGHNLFGQWTWSAEAGLRPARRDEEARHFVRVFDSPRDSVRAYLHNLNTHHAYSHFRTLRARAVQNNQPMTANTMTAGLRRYSERGWEYVREVRGLIESEALQRAVARAELQPLRQPRRSALAAR